MKSTPMKSGIIKSFDDTPIYYEIRGNGEPLIFVYGIACLMNHWHHQIEHFSEKYQTISFDLRGHHQSQPVGSLDRLNMEDIALDIQMLLKELGIKKAHFLGHSFGAPVMLSLYDRAPDIFLSMTYINGFAQNPIKTMFGLGIIEKVFYFVKAQYAAAPSVWEKYWKTSVDNPVAMLLAGAIGGFNLRTVEFKDIEIYARGVANMDLKVFLKLFEALMNFDGTEILSKIEVPTLVISGGRDNVTPQDFQHKFRDGIQGSEYVYLPYGSHCTQLDFPEYVNLKIEDFIERIMFRK